VDLTFVSMNKVSSFTIVTLLLNSSLTIMVGSVIAPALPAIADHLQFGFSPGLLVTLPSLGVVLFSPLIGKLVNSLGPFRLLIIGLLPYAILGFMGLYLGNTYVLVVDRLLLGATCVAIQIAVTSYIADLFEGKERLKMIAWQGVAIELGGVVFLSLGGVLGELNWSFPFYIYLVAILFFVFSWYALPRKVHRETEGHTALSTEANEGITPIMLGSFFSMAMFFVCFISLPEYLPARFDFSESTTGYFMSSISLVAVVVASQLARITDYISTVKLVIIGFLLFSVGYVIFAAATLSWMMYMGAVSVGIGFGFTVPVLNHLVVEASSVANRGKNLGTYSMMVFAGQFAATFIEFLPGDTQVVFYGTATLGLAVSFLLFFLFKREFTALA
jgi:MFS family permease